MAILFKGVYKSIFNTNYLKVFAPISINVFDVNSEPDVGRFLAYYITF